MKILTFWGGLGNQLFEYVYYEWLRKQYPNEKIYAYYPMAGLKSHNGLEVNRCFDVKLPATSFFSTLSGAFLFNVNRLCRRMGLPLIWTCTHGNGKYDAVFHCDYWQDKKYLSGDVGPAFKLGALSSANKHLLYEIQKGDFLAVHVRRGDYLSSKNRILYGGICTEDYYHRAIETVRAAVPDVRLLFFSDDPRYVRDTYKYDSMLVVDWNKGKDSIYDMYLMSKCRYMILANSTFSFWAAVLNKDAKTIICPCKWKNVNTPDIISDKWVRI